MPSNSSSSLHPGAHDPYNASSVKLAEATRIRLVLPGLGAVEKEENLATSSKTASTADLDSKADSAAARAKVRKKLLKIQGIANQAEKAHSSVIVDEGVLEAEVAAQEQGEAAGSTGTAACSNAACNKETAVAGAAGIEKRSSKHAGGAAGVQPGKGKRSSAGGTDTGKYSSRLTLPSTESPAAGGAVDADSAVSSTRSSAPSSRKGQQSDKPYLPIWERLLPQTPAEDRKVPPAVTQHKVFQPVAIKTFSPTLGSLGSTLTQDAAWPSSDDPMAMPARGAISSRSRSAARVVGQPADTTAAVGAQQRYFDSDRNAHPLSVSSKKPSCTPELMPSSRSKSFTGGYQTSSQLCEKLTLGNN